MYNDRQYLINSLFFGSTKSERYSKHEQQQNKKCIIAVTTSNVPFK